MAPRASRAKAAQDSGGPAKKLPGGPQVAEAHQDASQASTTPQTQQASAAIGVLKNQYMLKPQIKAGQTETEQFRLPLNLLTHWFFAKSRVTTDQVSASLGCCR
jgi:hypothetical protein